MSDCTACFSAAATRPVEQRKVTGIGSLGSLHNEAPQCRHDIQWNGPKKLRCFPTALHGTRYACCPDMTMQQSHLHHLRNDHTPQTIQNLDNSASENQAPDTKMDDLYEHYQPWTDLFHGQASVPAPQFNDKPLFTDNLGCGIRPHAQRGVVSEVLPVRSNPAATPPLMTGPGSSTESSILTPNDLTMPLHDQFFTASDGRLSFHNGAVEGPQMCLDLPMMVAGQDTMSTTDHMPMDNFAMQRRFRQGFNTMTMSRPSRADVDFLSTEAIQHPPFVMDLPVRQREPAPHVLPQQPLGCALEESVNDNITGPFVDDNVNGQFNRLDNHSTFNQLEASRYSVKDNAAPPIDGDSLLIDIFNTSTNQTASDITNNYPPLSSTMTSAFGEDMATREHAHGYAYDFSNDYKFHDDDPNLFHLHPNSIFFGYDPQSQPQIADFDFVTQPLSDPNISLPLTFDPLPAAEPVEQANEEKGRRDISRDQELLDLRSAGYSYRDIKQNFGFKEAESTLRGRYRTLTKNKDERVRKPEWKVADIRLLLNTVQDQSQASATITPSAFSYTDDGLPILHDESHLSKVSWKKVAESMAEKGAYRYGNATVKKKYVQVRYQKLFGTAAATDDSAAAATATGGACSGGGIGGGSGYAEMYS